MWPSGHKGEIFITGNVKTGGSKCDVICASTKNECGREMCECVVKLRRANSS